MAATEAIAATTAIGMMFQLIVGWLPSVAFVERHRGQVPLNFDEGGFNVSRFATRAWACGERVRYPTIFPKSLIRYLMNEG